MGQEIGATDYVNCEDRSFDEERFQRLAVKSTPRGDRLTQSFTTKKSALSISYDTIVAPILDLFVCSELVFVPEGSLCLAPFAAFKAPNSQYLCESYNIRVIPSLTSLKMIKDCPDDYHCRSGALLVGDPWVQDVNKLPPLPFAREEVEMI